MYLKFYRKRICSFGCCVLGFCVNALGASTGLIDGSHDVNEIVISSFVVCNEILNLAKSCENFSLLEMLQVVDYDFVVCNEILNLAKSCENFSLLVWLVGNKSICDLIW